AVTASPPRWEIGIYAAGAVVLLGVAALNLWKLWRSGTYPAPSPFPNYDYRYLEQKYGAAHPDTKHKVKGWKPPLASPSRCNTELLEGQNHPQHPRCCWGVWGGHSAELGHGSCRRCGVCCSSSLGPGRGCQAAERSMRLQRQGQPRGVWDETSLCECPKAALGKQEPRFPLGTAQLSPFNAIRMLRKEQAAPSPRDGGTVPAARSHCLRSARCCPLPAFSHPRIRLFIYAPRHSLFSIVIYNSPAPFTLFCCPEATHKHSLAVDTVGEILLSLSYLPTAERLTVVVVKAKNLVWTNGKVTADPFVKVYLLQDGRKISKKKTAVKRDDTNPVFNEAMIFSVPAIVLQELSLRVTVAECGEDGRADNTGHVLIGPAASGMGTTHWNQMLATLRRPVSMWHPLRRN
ncbi:SYT12 protein, partial [Eolophus roseicapillus]|nr:SYT12 protein [Eolophus roseicapilla]